MGNSRDLSAGPPPIPAALVEHIEAVFPDRFPDIKGPIDVAELHRQAGRLEVVRWLREHLTRQAAARPARPQLPPPSPF